MGAKKECATCHEAKPLSEFYTYTRIHCRPCESILRKSAAKEKKARVAREAEEEARLEREEQLGRERVSGLVTQILERHARKYSESEHSSDDSSDNSSEDSTTDVDTAKSSNLLVSGSQDLAAIVRIQGRTIRDLQKRMAVVEDMLLAQSASRLSINHPKTETKPKSKNISNVKTAAVFAKKSSRK